VAAGATFVSDIVLAFGTKLPLPHLWSLGVEEQFYLLWPFLLWLGLRRGWRFRTHGWLLGLVISAIVVHRLRLTIGGSSIPRLYFAPDTRLDSILVGSTLGLVYLTRPSVDRAARLLLGGAGPIALICIAAIAVGFSDSSRILYDGVLTLFAGLAGLVIAAAVYAPESAFSRALALQPFVFTGRISYSLYLWHPMVLSLGRKLGGVPTAAGIVLSFAAASTSYYLWERQFLRRKRRHTPPRSDSMAPHSESFA